MIPKPIRSTKTVNRTTSRGERFRGPTSIPRAMPFVVYRIGLATDAFSAMVRFASLDLTTSCGVTECELALA